MNPPWTRLLLLGMAAIVFLASFSSPALAADDQERLPPYDVAGLEHKRIWVPWVFAFVIAGGCIALAFKNPHRHVSDRT